VNVSECDGGVRNVSVVPAQACCGDNTTSADSNPTALPDLAIRLPQGTTSNQLATSCPNILVVTGNILKQAVTTSTAGDQQTATTARQLAQQG
jgi:hypothetical protein